MTTSQLARLAMAATAMLFACQGDGIELKTDRDAGADAARDVTPDTSADSGALQDEGTDADRDGSVTPRDMTADLRAADDTGMDQGADAAAPDCPGMGQQKSSFFTRRPADGGQARALEDVLIGLLDCAEVGSQVRATFYHLSRPRVADAFVRAGARGVDTKLILDWDNRDDAGALNGAVQTLQAALGADLIICGNAAAGACIGSNINHNKFATFSRLTDGSENVVLQSSSNMTQRGRFQHNNTVVVRNDAALWSAFDGYWEDLAAQVGNDDYYQRVDGDTDTRIYLSPRATGDTAVNVLGNMECAGGGRLRVAMSLFTTARSEVADRLVAMRANGCNISMVLRGDDEAPPAAILQILTAGGVPFVQYPERADTWNLHSKYWIWEGRYAGSAAARRIVFTGSHNWTGNALRSNDEVILRIEDDAVYTAFLADHGQLLIEAAN